MMIVSIMLDADGAIPQVDCTLSDGSPTEAIRNITFLCNSNMKEAGKGAVSVYKSSKLIKSNLFCCPYGISIF